MKRIGLIVNPYAGIGGRLGLEGEDGVEIRRKAFDMGAVPISPNRSTVEALEQITGLEFVLYTYPKEMGEEEALEACLDPIVLGELTGDSTAEDTKKAAAIMLKKDVHLLVFAGGDGTARDIYSVIDGRLPVLGIPTGIKIHSGVFAVNPRSAGDLLRRFISKARVNYRLEEVIDTDEEAYSNNILQARLYGYMKTLYAKDYVLGCKESSRLSHESSLRSIAAETVDEMKPGVVYVLGPGPTVKSIADRLGIQKTLLGVDVVKDNQIIAKDANEKQLLSAIKGEETKLIVNVIGKQGIGFDMGNLQISPQVIREIGRENIIIAATPSKLASLEGKPLRVNTGDSKLDEELEGYYRVHTGYGRHALYKTS